MAVTRRALIRASSDFRSELFSRTISLVNSRIITVIAAGCSVLYISFWALALLQNRGIIQTKLPIPVADRAIVERSHLELVPQAVAQQDEMLRTDLLERAQTGLASNPAASSALTLDIQATAPAAVRVTNGRGESTGLDPFSGRPVLSMSDGSYSGPFSDPQLVSIGHAMGSYRVQMLGTDTGFYTLTVRLVLNGDIDHAVQYAGTGQIFQDTILQTTVTVDLVDNQPELTVSDVDALTVGTAGPAIDVLSEPNEDAQSQTVVRLKPPARLPLPIPLPGVVLPPDTPILLPPHESALPSIPAAPDAPVSTITTSSPGSDWLTSGERTSSSGASPGDVNSGPTAADSADGDSLSSAAMPTVVSAEPTAVPSPVATSVPDATSASSSDSSTSSVSSAPGQSAASQPSATPTYSPTTVATSSPTTSQAASSSSPPASSPPTVSPTPIATPTVGPGSPASGMNGSNGGSNPPSTGTGGSTAPSSGSGGSTSTGGASHAQSAPGHTGDHGRSASSPGHTGAAPGKAK